MLFRSTIAVNEQSIREMSELKDRLPSTLPTSIAYVIFTSGSTGEPKGCGIEHRASCSAIVHHGPFVQFNTSTRALQFGSYSFAGSIAEMLYPLVHGGCICIPSEEERRVSLVAAISKMAINWAFLTPTILDIIGSPESVPSLTTICIGGEPIRASQIQLWESHTHLRQTYGSSETAGYVSSARLAGISTTKDVGKANTAVYWIVDPNDHDRLAPLGAAGELLIEGPVLGREYIDEVEKTAATFVHAPAWRQSFNDSKPRLYKTGDLAKYKDDGSIELLGRKDTQIKLRGQRIELGEIEHQARLSDAARVKGLAVELIKTESKDNMLACFISVEMNEQVQEERGEVLPASCAQMAVQTIRERLEQFLPQYMVPTLFVPLAQLPTTSSQKVDRKLLREMGASLTVQQLAEMQTSREGPKRQPTMEIERMLQQLWARVLNIDADSIGLDDSFFRLGGDSITAMQISSNARKLGIPLLTRDILEKKTIFRMARHTERNSSVHAILTTEENLHTPFDLTPIQRLYLELDTSGQPSFDMSFFVELSLSVQIESLRIILSALVRRHSMLRARFRKGVEETWQQYILNYAEDSFTIEHILSDDVTEIAQSILQSRSNLDIQNGPVLAVVLCDEGGRQSLFVAVHHLVFDLVSWRVLLEELEDLLLGRMLPPISSTPFQAWQAAQAKYVADNAHSFAIAETMFEANHLSYWGLNASDVLLCNTMSEQFVINQEMTSALIGSCNNAFGTRPIELMLAALAQSFAVAFPDRKVPIIFNEIHGRETWDDNIDIVRTIGWFTGMFPLQMKNSAADSLFDIIRQTKDCIRNFQYNGWSYFASRFVDESTVDAFVSKFPVEVMLNYQGLYQQLERKGSLFKSKAIPEGCEPVSTAKTPRFALFDVLLEIDRGCMVVNFISDRNAKHRERVADWTQQFKATLTDMTAFLKTKAPEWTLSDVPLVFSSYADLDQFRLVTLPELDIRAEDVEDMFPCSAMQEGILTSQSKDMNVYWHSFMWEVVPKQEHSVTVARLREAWRAVVRRHSLLRTLIIGNVPGSSGHTNVVLKSPEPNISFFTDPSETVTVETFRARHNSASQHVGRLQYHLSICQLANQKVYISLNINHAIVDAHSRAIVARDFQRAYDFELDPYGVSFKDVIAYQKGQSQEEASFYWSQYLDGVEPCYFPSITPAKEENSRVLAVNVPDLDASAIHTFCQTWEVTPATIIQTAWALVLSRYTDSMTPCFGNLASGRDLPIDGVNDIFGPLMAMLACRVNIHEQLTVIEALKSVQLDYINSVSYQTFSLASMHSLLKLGTSALFNTALSLQRVDNTETSKTSSVALDFQEGQDLTEVRYVLWNR